MRNTSSFAEVQRKEPTQERGKKRVEAILDAAAEVFARAGFESATMDEIAAQAESSIGSVYQFFPNKEALFIAIAERCIERSRSLFDEILTPELMSKGWEEILTAFVDAYFEHEATDVNMRALYANLHLHGTYEAADAALLEELVDRTSALLSVYAWSLSPKKRKIVAKTVVNVTTSFLFMTRSEPAPNAKKMLEELKLLLIRYLRPYAEEAG
jgi:AcrR family transcriptional regulator